MSYSAFVSSRSSASFFFRVPDDDQLFLAPLNGGIARFVSGRPRAEPSSELSLICSPSATLPGLPTATRAATFYNGIGFRDFETFDVLVQPLLPLRIDRRDSLPRRCCGIAPTARKPNSCRCQRFSSHLGRTLVARVGEILSDRNRKPRFAPANRACAAQKGLEMPPVPRRPCCCCQEKKGACADCETCASMSTPGTPELADLGSAFIQDGVFGLCTCFLGKRAEGALLRSPLV
jgi:hypothetical protein